MPRAWHGAYVQTQSQSEVASAVQGVIEGATDRKLLLMVDPAGVEYRLAALSLQLLCVSPQEGEWVAFWGATQRLCSLVFEQKHLSGLLIGGEYEILEQLDHSSYWYYMIWQEGVIVDWFVSRPRYYFKIWSESARKSMIIPYLVRLGAISHADRVKGTGALNLVEEHSELFSGDLNAIRSFALSSLSAESIKAWLASSARWALVQIPEILAVPFGGPDYDIVSMAVYHDVRRGVLSPSPQDYPYQDSMVKDAYEWSKSTIRRVSEFRPMAFQWVNAESGSPRLDQFRHVFYWG